MKEEPVGELKTESVVIRRQGKCAVYCAITFVDENGKHWYVETGHFRYDLKPVIQAVPSETWTN
jgi:hypothetical protein